MSALLPVQTLIQAISFTISSVLVVKFSYLEVTNNKSTFL
jgi:hypothetical protein